MITLIGGTGFLGKELCCVLHRRGIPAATISRTPDRTFLADHAPSVQAYESSTDAARAAIARSSTIIYMAHTSRPATESNAPGHEIEGNLLNAAALMEMVQTGNNPHMIYISSGGQIYGEGHTRPIPETVPPQPITSYGLGKALIEDLMAFYSRCTPLKLTILRLANPVGTWQLQGSHGLVAAAVKAAVRQEPIMIFGAGNKARDYFDASQFSEFIATNLAPDGQGCSLSEGTFNIGSGIARVELDIVALVERSLQLKVPYKLGPDRKVDLSYAVLDPSRARAELGWHNADNLEPIVKRMADFLAQSKP